MKSYLGFSLVMTVFDMKVSGKQIKNKMILNKEAIILCPKFGDFQRRFLSMWVMRLCDGRFFLYFLHNVLFLFLFCIFLMFYTIPPTLKIVMS